IANKRRQFIHDPSYFESKDKCLKNFLFDAYDSDEDGELNDEELSDDAYYQRWCCFLNALRAFGTNGESSWFHDQLEEYLWDRVYEHRGQRSEKKTLAIFDEMSKRLAGLTKE